jgi:hypothetical protein
LIPQRRKSVDIFDKFLSGQKKGLLKYYTVKEQIKEIKQTVYNFIWKSKTDLVNRNTLILPYEKGGLSLI